MTDKDVVGMIGGCVTLVFVTLAASIFMPLIYAASGYFTGWMLAQVFTFAGDWVVRGASSVGLQITRDSLPIIGAFLGFIGAFFRSYSSTSSSKK